MQSQATKSIDPRLATAEMGPVGNVDEAGNEQATRHSNAGNFTATPGTSRPPATPDMLAEVYAEWVFAGKRALAGSRLRRAARLRAWVSDELKQAHPRKALVSTVYEFAAYDLPCWRGLTPALLFERGIEWSDHPERKRERQSGFQPDFQSHYQTKSHAENAARQAAHRALAGARWDLYEVLKICNDDSTTKTDESGNRRSKNRPGILLRRLLDESTVYVRYSSVPFEVEIGELALWRVVQTGEPGEDAWAPPPLRIPPEGIDGLIYWLACEEEAYQEAKLVDPRAAWRMRRSAEWLLMKHAFCPQHRLILPDHTDHGSGFLSEALVSPAEAGLARDSWRRLGQAFSLLEACVEYSPALTLPQVSILASGRQLHVARLGPRLVVTLLESASELRRWLGAVHRPNGSPQAVPFIRAWRAMPEELSADDLMFLKALGFRAHERGAALAVRLDEDFRWEDLDQQTMNRLIEALHQASSQLRRRDGLAA